MAEETINPNVVLTADNSQYDQAMMASAGQTQALADSVDNLTKRLDNLTKSAGRKLVGIAAADVAVITAATTAWGAYEKQIQRLQAQSAVLSRTQDQQERILKRYEGSVRDLRKEYGTTTGEAAKLTQQISKMTDPRQRRQLGDLSKVFMDMSEATGESSDGLATSLLNLNKVMGSSTDPKTVRAYSDQLTTLAAGANTTAGALADFASQIAPTGRLLGLSQTAVTGVSKAFIQAGQDGYQAATAFNTIVTDIAQATSSGSPRLALYANLIGTTVEQFKSMRGQDQVVQIFNRLAELGPRASVELQRMGLDGVRTMRALTAVTQQTGGIGSAITEAERAYGSGSSARGREAAMKGITDDFARLRQELQMIGEDFATIIGPAVSGIVSTVEKLAGAFEDLMAGPMGEALQVVAGLAGSFTGAAGAVLLMAAALTKLATAALVLRGSGMLGFREGRQGFSRVVGDGQGGFGPTPGGMLGPTGQRIADRGSWFQRLAYNTFQPVGAAVGATPGLGPGAPGQPGFFARMGNIGMNATAFGVRNLGVPLFSPAQHWLDPTRRTRLFNAQTFGGSMSTAYGATVQPMANWVGRTFSVNAQGQVTQQAGAPQQQQQQTTQQRAAQAGFLASVFPNATTGTLSQMAVNTQMAASTRAASAQIAGLGRETGITSGGFRNLSRATAQLMLTMGGAAAGGVGWAGSMLGKGLMKYPGPIGLTAGTGLLMSGAGESMGINNTLSMGLMGMMLGAPGVVAGTAAGAVIDATKANDGVQAQIDLYGELQEEQAGLAASYKVVRDSAQETDKFQKRMADTQPSQIPKLFYKPGDYLGSTKNWIESVFGDSDVEEITRDNEKIAADFKNQEKAVRGLAAAMNIPITGDIPTQMAKLDQVLADAKPRMDEVGISLDDLKEAFAVKNLGMEGATGILGSILPKDTYDELIQQIMNPGAASGLHDRLRATNRAGELFAGNRYVQMAIESPGDINAQYRAISSFFTEMRQEGMDFRQIVRQTGAAMAEIGDVEAPEYVINQAAMQRAQQALQFQLPTMGRAQGFAMQAGMFADIANMPGGPEQQQMMEEAMATMLQSAEQQRQHFVQLLYQQREFQVSQARAQEDFGIQRARQEEEFGIMRSRAQADFHLQRQYQEHDYQLSRERAEESYQISRGRAQEQFSRSMNRSQRDFNISRRRQEEDYQHQIKLMTEQTAMSAYNIYERVNVQRTNSATFVLFNAQDQLERLEQQTRNLDRLRGMGLSDQAIQQLGLTDPNNAQQLARFVSEVANNPQMIKELNEAIRKRLRAAGELATDESSKDWKEFERQYRLATRRAQADFERSVRQSRRDFKIQMGQMEEDFQRSMTHQAEDYETAQQRQQKQFSLSMRRAAQDYGRSVDNMTEDFGRSMKRAQQDLNRMSEEITGSLRDILIKSTNRLDGAAQRQARKVLRTFRGLSSELGPEANEIMQLMSDIFGFKFTPKKTKPHNDATDGASGEPGQNPGAFASGGVLPGRSIGRDNMHFFSKDHGELHLAGGEAIMVPEWVDQMGGPQAIKEMNHRARHGNSFFLGGVMPAPKGAVEVNRHSGYPWAVWAGDLNVPGDETGNPVVAWKSGRIAETFHGYGDSHGRYGNHIQINHPDSDQSTLYAHLSQIAVKIGDLVSAGQRIGAVGNTGHSFGAHLHFEVKGGSVSLGDVGAGVGGGLGGGAFEDIIKANYPGVEKAAAEVSLLGGFSKGFWSRKLNRMARGAWNRAVDKYGMPSGSTQDDAGVPPPPGDLTSNQAYVRRAMRQFGWNQWPSLYQLVMHESGFNNTAQNPTSSAYGMFQFLDSTWAGVGGHKTSDPWLQSIYGMRYIKNRYDDPNGAWRFWQNNNWYGEGGIFQGAQRIGVGEFGPEMVLPLDGRGTDFLASLMSKVSAGVTSKQTRVPGSTPVTTVNNTYQIDRSTTFTGAITVQANNPQELISKLRARQQVRALSQPALAGAVV